MPYESPYQSMVENEVLFQQQPWLKRIPHQIRHAVTPVSDALTGTGAGLIAGTALGSPRAGAAIGGVLGGLHGVLAHNPTPAQEWAYNNPELVHVLKARAAYDAGDGFEMGKAAQEKVAISSGLVARAYKNRLMDESGEGPARRVNLFRILRPENGNGPVETLEPSRQRGDEHATLSALLEKQKYQGPPLPSELTRAARISDREKVRRSHLDAAQSALVSAIVEAAHESAPEVSQAPIRTGENMAARAAATPKAPTPAPQAPASAPKSNLRRNLGIGAAAVAIPTLAYTAYRHFADKPETEKAHEAGKTAMLRTLGF